jgi:hypothetical protein
VCVCLCEITKLAKKVRNEKKESENLVSKFRLINAACTATDRGLATMAFADAGKAKAGAGAAEAVAGFVSDEAIMSTTVELVQCLVDKSVGFECLLARRLFAASAAFPSRYTGGGCTNRKQLTHG